MEIKVILRNKKGMGIGDIYPVVLTITLVAILLAVSMMIFSEWTEVTNTESATVTNETGAWINNTVYYVDNYSVCGFNTLSVSQMVNATSGQIIGSGNYTIDADAGTINGATGRTANYSTCNVTYTYLYGGEDCEALEDIIEDYTDFVPWIGIILLVIAAAIVLGVLIRSFSGTGNRV